MASLALEKQQIEADLEVPRTWPRLGCMANFIHGYSMLHKIHKIYKWLMKTYEIRTLLASELQEHTSLLHLHFPRLEERTLEWAGVYSDL